MLVAEKLRQENIAEYLLYMWQVEDLIRTCKFDLDTILKSVKANSLESDEDKEKIATWYSDLIEMMRAENITESGHLQINNNVIINLTDLHRMLLKSPKYPQYGAEFYRTLPIIVELRAKAGENKVGEVETCFNALYGMWMMKLSHQEISHPTMLALTQITKFVSTLAHYYHKDKQSPLFDKEDYDNL